MAIVTTVINFAAADNAIARTSAGDKVQVGVKTVVDNVSNLSYVEPVLQNEDPDLSAGCRFYLPAANVAAFKSALP